MLLPDNHQCVEIESFEILGSVCPGVSRVGLRPVTGQHFSVSLLLEGNRSLSEDYPVGTRFRVQAALMKRPGGADYLFSSWQWDVKIIAKPDREVWLFD